MERNLNNKQSREESSFRPQQQDPVHEEQKSENLVNQFSQYESIEVIQMSPSKWETQTPYVRRREEQFLYSPKQERKQRIKEAQQKAQKLDLESCIRVLTYGVTSETNSPTKRQEHDPEVCNVIVPCLYCPLQNNQASELLKYSVTSEKFSKQLLLMGTVSSKLEQNKQLERADSFEDENGQNDWFQEEGFNKVKRRKRRLLSITEKGKILKYGYGETAHDQNPNSTGSFMKGNNLPIPKSKKH